MDYVVYILYSRNYNTTYVGYTSDLITRFKFHNELSTKGHTKKFRPWEVMHVEFYPDKKSAMIREKYLKTGTGRDFIKNIIIAGFISAAADTGSAPVFATKTNPNLYSIS